MTKITSVKNDKVLQETIWDLSILYKDINDSQIEKDFKILKEKIKNFANFKNKLKTKLEESLKEEKEIKEYETKLFMYFFLQRSTDSTNQKIKQIESKYQEEYSRLSAKNSFYKIEIGKLSEIDFQKQIKKSKFLQHHLPYLNDIREYAKHYLSEEVETVLTKREPFGTSEWYDLMTEFDTLLEFEIDGKKYKKEEMIKKAAFDPSSEIRRDALKKLNEGLETSNYTLLRTRSLNVMTGLKAVADADRGYKHPMALRNLLNKLDDATVQTLHEVVIDLGTKECMRFYKLFAKLLGKEKLMWSDRNAPLAKEKIDYIPFEKAKEIVISAYQSFSLKLAEKVKMVFDKKWVHASVTKTKKSGAYDYTNCALNNVNTSMVFLNYQGRLNDIGTLAHEMGHACHGLIAADKQGSMMWHPPMTYAETASIFGEAITFNYLNSKLDNPKKKLDLILDKCQKFINSVQRQISFSLFEQGIHEKRKSGKVTTQEMQSLWLEVTEKLYGKNGDVFIYENHNNLWAYMSKFMRPFYVYAYAFGELFTQSIYALKDTIPDFEKKYIDLLAAGGTKSAVELLEPFGLDPREKTFWENGIKVGLSKWIDEIEMLAKELKLI